MKNTIKKFLIITVLFTAKYINAQVYDLHVNYKLISGVGITYEQQNWFKDRVTSNFSYFYHPKGEGEYLRYVFKSTNSNGYVNTEIYNKQREAASFYFGHSFYMQKSAKNYSGFLSGFNALYKIGYKVYKSALIDTQKLNSELRWLGKVEDNNLRIMPSFVLALGYKSNAPNRVFWQLSIGVEWSMLPDYKNINNISPEQLKTYEEVQNNIQTGSGLALPIYSVFSIGYRID
jgi:hypothetical protein